jgi:acylphosphatase
MMKKRLTAFVSGAVQKVGYRARVMDFAKMLGLSGTVENQDDGRVKILASVNNPFFFISVFVTLSHL